MKPRRVMVTLEMTTDLGLSELRSGGDWMLALADYWMPEGDPTRQCKMTPQVHQVTVNVVRAKPKARGKGKHGK